MNNDSFETEFKTEKTPEPQNSSTTKGIVGFVLGLSCIITCCIPFIGEYLMMILSIVSIILCARQIKAKSTGLAVAGLVLGIIFLVLAVISIILSAIFNYVIDIDKIIEGMNNTTSSFNLFMK